MLFVDWSCPRALGAVALGATLAFALPAASAETPPAADAPAVTPPRLASFVEADYPAEALAERSEADVGLLLTIGADGVVTDVQVIGPAGQGFDEAAHAAALRFRFEPAMRGSPSRPRSTGKSTKSS